MEYQTSCLRWTFEYKMSKIEKCEDWIDSPSESEKMTFYMIFCAKLDFQIFNPAVIPSEGPTLEASRALLRRKNFEG